MLPRSYLYVPGDAPEKLHKALGRGADALIVDLEDAVAPARKAEARTVVTEWLKTLPAAGEHTVTPVTVAVHLLGEGGGGAVPNKSLISAELPATPG